MSSARPSRYSSEPPPEPELVKLEPAGRRAGSWRLAAVVLAFFLVGVVVAGRLGMEAPSTGSASPTPSSTSASSPDSRPSPAPAASPVPSEAPTTPPSVDGLPEVARYLDGLPTSIGGEKVYRLDGALSRATGRELLVGGWYVGPGCIWPSRCVRQLADSPGTSPYEGNTVALAGIELRSLGPYVLRVTRNDECSESDDPECYPVFDVLEQVWAGDLLTRSGPIEAGPLLGALNFAFPELRAEPFRDLARCPVEWPPQTYRSITGGPRMTVIFPTVEDRLASEQAVRGNWPQPASYPGAQCLDQFMDQGEPAGWIAEDNVMIWVTQDAGTVALARAAILDARSQSQAQTTPTPRPVTTWAALRTLRAWEADLEVLPPHDTLVWGPGLGPEGEQRLAEAYGLSDPLIRVLLVFPDPAERRLYQIDVDPADVAILDNVRLTQEMVAAALIEARRAGVRWLAYRNVLLQVAGPEQFDRELRRFLRNELN